MSISEKAKYSCYSGRFKILCSVRSLACAVGCFAIFQDISLAQLSQLNLQVHATSQAVRKESRVP